MTLTSEQKMRAIELLNRLDQKEIDAILINETSFSKWLKRVAFDIYQAICKFADAISDAWYWIKSVFM